MKLKTKIISAVVLLYILVNILFAFLYISDMKSKSMKKLNKKIDTVSMLLDQVNSSPLYEIDIIKIKKNLNAFLNDPEIISISLKEYEGNIVINVGASTLDKNELIEVVSSIKYANELMGEVTTVYSKKIIEEEIQESFLQFLLYSLLGALVVSMALSMLIQQFVSPIIKLTKTISEITKGNLEEKINIKRSDEIGKLASHFEIMRSSLKERIDTIHLQNKEILNFNQELESKIENRTQELLAQKKLFETLINSMPDIVWMKNKDGIYLHCNRRFSEFFGDTQEGIIGNTDYDYVDKELADFFLKHDKNAMNSDIPLINYEIIPFASDGHEEYTQTMKTAIKDDEGNILGVLGVGRNLTKEQEQKLELEKTIENLKITQDKLVESEKMSSLGVLVAGIAHEINTPIGIGLTGATYFLEITEKLKKDYDNENMSQEEFENFINTSKEIASLINTNLNKTALLVKNFKKISFDQSSEEKRNINLKEYVKEILFSMSNIIKKTNITIKNNCSDKINIDTYPGAISQIITNLIINSIRHAFKEKEKGNIFINATMEENIIKLIYKDNGQGIDEEFLPKIFDPFFTTNRHSGGTGLGLNILYNIISHTLNGTIQCNSKKNYGVEFIILFQENKFENENKLDKDILWQI